MITLKEIEEILNRHLNIISEDLRDMKVMTSDILSTLNEIDNTLERIINAR
jgi:hypothetical protein